MAARKSAFTIDATALLKLGDRLASIDDAMLDKSMVNDLNRIVDDVYETARGRMNAGINLTDAYLQDHMQVVHATPERGLRAEIVARGGKSNLTPLGRYFAGQDTVSAPRAKGDASRGIAPGRKQAGVRVEVSRGSSKLLMHGFTMPLKAGSESGGNGLGIFTRTKYGLKRHRYGPAVYQLFRVAAEELEESVGDRLEALGAVAAKALEKALE